MGGPRVNGPRLLTICSTPPLGALPLLSNEAPPPLWCHTTAARPVERRYRRTAVRTVSAIRMNAWATRALLGVRAFAARVLWPIFTKSQHYHTHRWQSYATIGIIHKTPAHRGDRSPFPT